MGLWCHLRQGIAALACVGMTLTAVTVSASTVSILDGLQLSYSVDFRSGGVSPSVDTLGIGPLKLGDTNVAGSGPTWSYGPDGLAMSITHPAGVPDLVGLGAFATPVSFNPGSVFGMRATFAAPTGPHTSGNTWAVALFARTGGDDLLPTDITASATLQVRGAGARLNLPGASVPANLPNVPQSVYDTLFPVPGDSAAATFTLEMIVDRVTGFGEGALYVGDFAVLKTFQFAVFLPGGGPTITAVGPALAISNAQGQSASVRVEDFEIFTPVPEPGTWMLMASGLAIVAWRSRRANAVVR